MNSIIVEDGNPVYDSRDNCEAIIETATNTLKQGCSSSRIPATVVAIGPQAFAGQLFMMSIAIPESVKEIGVSAFNCCTYLRNVVIPDSVVRIGNNAFGTCNRLKSVTLGSGLTEIGASCFSGCSSLTSVTCRAQVPPACVTSTFNDRYSKATLHVKRPSLDAYRAHEVWSQFSNIEALPGAGPGDVNGDGEFSVSDITMLINLLMSAGEGTEYNADADVNGDGIVNITDVSLLINQVLLAI